MAALGCGSCRSTSYDGIKLLTFSTKYRPVFARGLMPDLLKISSARGMSFTRNPWARRIERCGGAERQLLLLRFMHTCGLGQPYLIITREVQPGREIFTNYGPWFPYARHDMSRRVQFNNEVETTAALPARQQRAQQRLLSSDVAIV